MLHLISRKGDTESAAQGAIEPPPVGDTKIWRAALAELQDLTDNGKE
jgi:hypothetical protein